MRSISIMAVFILGWFVVFGCQSANKAEVKVEPSQVATIGGVASAIKAQTSGLAINFDQSAIGLKEQAVAISSSATLTGTPAEILNKVLPAGYTYLEKPGELLILSAGAMKEKEKYLGYYVFTASGCDLPAELPTGLEFKFCFKIGDVYFPDSATALNLPMPDRCRQISNPAGGRNFGMYPIGRIKGTWGVTRNKEIFIREDVVASLGGDAPEVVSELATNGGREWVLCKMEYIPGKAETSAAPAVIEPAKVEAKTVEPAKAEPTKVEEPAETPEEKIHRLKAELVFLGAGETREEKIQKRKAELAKLEAEVKANEAKSAAPAPSVAAPSVSSYSTEERVDRLEGKMEDVKKLLQQLVEQEKGKK